MSDFVDIPIVGEEQLMVAVSPPSVVGQDILSQAAVLGHVTGTKVESSHRRLETHNTIELRAQLIS